MVLKTPARIYSLFRTYKSWPQSSLLLRRITFGFSRFSVQHQCKIHDDKRQHCSSSIKQGKRRVRCGWNKAPPAPPVAAEIVSQQQHQRRISQWHKQSNRFVTRSEQCRQGHNSRNTRGLLVGSKQRHSFFHYSGNHPLNLSRVQQP